MRVRKLLSRCLFTVLLSTGCAESQPTVVKLVCGDIVLFNAFANGGGNLYRCTGGRAERDVYQVRCMCEGNDVLKENKQ